MATTRDINALKSRFGQFESVADPDIAIALDAADVWLDPTQWIAADYPLARILWAAHFLSLQEIQLSQKQSGSGGGTTDLFVRSVGIGDRRVMYGERRTDPGSEAMLGPGEEMLGRTIYGQMFLQLRARNFPAVVVV